MKKFIYLIAILFAVCLPLGAQASGPGATKYPIVLVHGLYGFEKLFGGIVVYWNNIPSALTQDGAQVYLVQVSPIDSYEARGEQTLAQVENILAITGAQKVNLIGHSMGAGTIRYVAGVRPDLVASLTTVDGVVQGSAVADAIEAANSDIIYSVLQLLGGLIKAGAGDPSYAMDVKTGIHVLTSNYLQNEFNPKYPKGLPTTPCGNGPEVVDGIHYYSWRGDRVLTNPVDFTDALLVPISTIFGFNANDGLVATCAQNFGKVVGTYHQNHLDQVKLMWGLINIFEVDPATIFRNHASRLKNAGL